jgi:hypothetical protein
MIVSRLGSWLREPVKVRHSEVDWDDFNRTFGRAIGGHSESFNEKPKPFPPDPSRPAVGEPTNTPRWVLLLGITIGVGIPVGFAVAIFWLSR